MIRSNNLDNIAPDDPILETPISNPIDPVKKDIPLSKKTEVKEIKKDKLTSGPHPRMVNILGHTKSPFSAFLVYPHTFDFPEREENEVIILAVRSHWFVNIKWFLTTIAMFFLPTVLNFLDVLNFLPFKYQIISTLFWYLITFIYAFEKFLDWYFDVFAITNQRLVDIKFNNLLNKHFAEADLEMIQDVSSSVRGVFGTFFNYGTILIQTASEINQIIFKNVPNPEKIIKALRELQNITEERNRGGKR